MLSDEVVSSITDESIEISAERLLLEYAGEAGAVSAPVPIELIAEHYLGYDLEITDEGLFVDREILGGISFETGKIFVNASVEENEGRYAFTVAHEVGHHVLHRELYLKHILNTSRILCREVTKKPLIERQADRFAAALLAPRILLQTSRFLVGPRIPCQSFPEAMKLSLEVKADLNFTNVSLSALFNRLKELGYISEQVPHQTGTRWCAGRQPFWRFLLNKYLELFGIR